MFYKPHDSTSGMIYDLKYHGDKYLGLWLGRLLAKEMQTKEMTAPLLFPIKVEEENGKWKVKSGKWKAPKAGSSSRVARSLQSGGDIRGEVKWKTENEKWRVENGERKEENGEDSNFFEGIDMIIPVPISRGRRWKRGYNQSELIARGISEVTGIPLRTDILRRVHFDRSQTKLTVLERTENVEHAFELKAAKAKDVSGKHILLVDDIITTGATITACAKELMKAGEVKFSVASVGFTK